jgi:hypothetical protein
MVGLEPTISDRMERQMAPSRPVILGFALRFA